MVWFGVCNQSDMIYCVFHALALVITEKKLKKHSLILQCKIGVISPFWQYIIQNPIKRICKMAIPVRLGFIHFMV